MSICPCIQMQPVFGLPKFLIQAVKHPIPPKSRCGSLFIEDPYKFIWRELALTPKGPWFSKKVLFMNNMAIAFVLLDWKSLPPKTSREWVDYGAWKRLPKRIDQKSNITSCQAGITPLSWFWIAIQRSKQARIFTLKPQNTSLSSCNQKTKNPWIPRYYRKVWTKR